MTRETVAAATLQIDVYTTTADNSTCARRETAAAPATIAPLAASVKRANHRRVNLSKFNSTTATKTTNCYNSYDRDRTRSTTLLKSITTKRRDGDFIVLH
uniref:Uncharacterized protein n=1 Tax=Bactrocera latifrons TaxID=174628 RepID=A0A0K8UEM2_BACLA